MAELELGEALEALANQLVWRIGRADDEGDVIIRVGYATALPAFATLPRLRAVTDAELETARRERRIRTEWVRSPAAAITSPSWAPLRPAAPSDASPAGDRDELPGSDQAAEPGGPR